MVECAIQIFYNASSLATQSCLLKVIRWSHDIFLSILWYKSIWFLCQKAKYFWIYQRRGKWINYL